MPRKRYTPEQTINSLREAEVLLSQGSTTYQAARHLGITPYILSYAEPKEGNTQGKR